MDRRLISLMPSCCFLSLDYYSSFCHDTMYMNCICSLNNRTFFFFFHRLELPTPIFRPSIPKLGIASFSSFSLSWAAFTWLTDSSCPAGSVRFLSVLKSSVQSKHKWFSLKLKLDSLTTFHTNNHYAIQHSQFTINK